MAASWQVTGQRATTQLAAGQFIDGQNVYFTTGLGHQGSVFVPLNRISDQTYIAELVQARADALDSIGSLSSDSAKPAKS